MPHWYWIATLAHEFAHVLFWVFRRAQPGQSYVEQEIHAEALALKLLRHWGCSSYVQQKARSYSRVYLKDQLRQYTGKKRMITELHHASL